jgi:hypothetical protein
MVSASRSTLATEADDDLQVGLEYRPPHRSAGDGVAAA